LALYVDKEIIMKHRLNEFRYRYKTACSILGGLNRIKAGPRQKGRIMSHMNRLRLQFKNEIKRVSWLLWPITGRPYIGQWKVIDEITSECLFIGDAIQCISFKRVAIYGYRYQVAKVI